MATITQTVAETLTFTAKSQKPMKLKLHLPETVEEKKEPEARKRSPEQCPPDCEDCKRMISQLCPADCKECQALKLPPKELPANSRFIPLIFNAIGLFIALLATYLILTTDSHLYLVFWVTYSVLRRMMVKSKPRVKIE